jgi:predicted membrane channel-forming protein YqfA (hemolysin III family)
LPQLIQWWRGRNGNNFSSPAFPKAGKRREEIVNGLIYLIGLIVVILFILSFLGLR